MTHFRYSLSSALCTGLLFLPAIGFPAHDTHATGTGLGSWRIGPSMAAPWASAGPGEPLANADLTGTVLHLDGQRLHGPAPLACTDAHYAHAVSPAEGLFQGNLPAPAEHSAAVMGITRLPLMTLEITCSTGIFALHLLDMETALLGFDNVIWTLQREALPATPELRVQQLLIEHMTSNMGFDPDTAAAKVPHLSESLRTAITAYFARPFPADEVPPISGDPFTDSQEYPSRFELGDTHLNGTRAIVPVRFGDGRISRNIAFELVFDGQDWLVDDVRYEDGSGLHQRLLSAVSSRASMRS